jgi:hypothetical protein
MPGLCEIGDGFLKGCVALRGVDLSKFSSGKIRIVGHDFMANCSAIKAVDLASLTSVECIGDGFLAQCESIEVLDLSPLEDAPIVKVGANFLQGCSGLKASPPRVQRVKSLGKLLRSISLEGSDVLELTE